ncbi:hypothetical protein COJ40_08030 [Bacillus cereus]|nr:hypothetical protein COJ40_08030 [Bacillus cereus]
MAGSSHTARTKGRESIFEFSWSLLKYKLVLDCSRKYGYEYYVNHHRWLSYGIDPPSKQVYRLKKLFKLPILLRQITQKIVNSMVEVYLTSGYSWDENELIEKGRLMLRNPFIIFRYNIPFSKNVKG